MFTRAFARTVATIRSPHFMGLLIKTALITLLVFILFVIGAGAAMRSFDLTQGGWMEWVIDAMLTFGAGFVAWLLLPVLVPAIAAFFQESIADTIEKRDYPDFVPPALQRPLMQELWEDSKFVLLIVAVNLLFFVTYFIPFVGFFTYYGVNGYLIGREFFETAAARHIGKRNAKQLRKEYPAPAFLCGVLIVFCTNVPLLNLVAPFIGVAIMVHLFHLLPKKEEYLPPLRDVT
jgi:CysZ protein